LRKPFAVAAAPGNVTHDFNPESRLPPRDIDEE